MLAAIMVCVLLLGGVGATWNLLHARPALATASMSTTPPLPVGTIACPQAPGVTNTYLTCEYAGADGARMTFYLYVPRHLSAGQRYPLVLVLQGGGERAKPTLSAEQIATCC